MIEVAIRNESRCECFLGEAMRKLDPILHSPYNPCEVMGMAGKEVSHLLGEVERLLPPALPALRRGLMGIFRRSRANGAPS